MRARCRLRTFHDPQHLHLAAVRLSAVISDHMVVQVGKAVTIWSWAVAGEEVTLEFPGQKKSTQAENGKMARSFDDAADLPASPFTTE